jgi:hypothetical protein
MHFAYRTCKLIIPSALFCSVNKHWRIHWTSSKAQLLLTNVSSQLSKHYSGKRTRNSYEWCSFLLLYSVARSNSYHPTNTTVYHCISIWFCVTTFSGSLNSFTYRLPQSRDSSYYVSIRYWHLHHSACRKTLIYAHPTSRTLPTCYISLGSLTLPAPEPGVFVEIILPCSWNSFSHPSLHQQRI